MDNNSEPVCGCVKEPTGTIPIMRVITKLDSLYSKCDYEEAGRVLSYWENEARSLNDKRGLLEILSEEIGYFRKIDCREKGLRSVEEAFSLLECQETDGISAATVYLNGATALKAFGRASESLLYYDKARLIYEGSLPADDFRLAGLFNNTATAYAELKQFDVAEELYLKAANVLELKTGCLGELAVTYVNLARLYYDWGETTRTEREQECERYMNLAWQRLDSDAAVRDGNYAFICSKCAFEFDFFGFFVEAAELRKREVEIYARS